jgi:hypothetical protein
MSASINLPSLSARTISPIPPPCRFHYLLRCAPNGMLCSVCSGVYLTLKGTALLKGARLLATSAALVLRRGALYGSYVSKEDVMEGGGIGGACPICQVGAGGVAGHAAGCRELWLWRMSHCMLWHHPEAGRRAPAIQCL